MTDPYLAAGRAYCLAKFDYDGGYARADGREKHIAADAASTAATPWLRAVVDAALAAARPGEATSLTVTVTGVVDAAAVDRVVREALRRHGRRAL